MRTEIDTEIDVGFSYRGRDLFYPAVPVTGYVAHGAASYWETSWSDAQIHVNLTTNEITAWLVELFEDEDLPVPSWAFDEAAEVLIEIEDSVEAHIDVG